jgi:cadmium resistance protein CadD (predicted permease)
MAEPLLILAVATTAYLSTSLDNLLVLTGLLTVSRRPAAVVLGHGLTSLLVIGLALVLARVDRLFTPETIGLLGLIPLTMGVVGLVRLLRRGDDVEATAGRAPSGVAATVAALLPLSGDSLGVFVPLLAETPPSGTPLIVGTHLGLSVVWALIATRLGTRPGVRHYLARTAGRIVPVLLILIGLYVLSDTPTDTLVASPPP